MEWLPTRVASGESRRRIRSAESVEEAVAFGSAVNDGPQFPSLAFSLNLIALIEVPPKVTSDRCCASGFWFGKIVKCSGVDRT